MTKISVNSGFGLDITKLDFSSLYYAYDALYSSTIYRLYYANGGIDEFKGSGFRYDSYGTPIAGTVTSYAGFYNGTKLFQIDGAKIAATSIVKAAGTYSTADDYKLVASILGGADTISGGNAKDVLNGYAGNDVITGNGGNDALIGGAGNDKLTGGSGKDYLYGEAGADTFIYKTVKDSTVATSGRDTIFDFSHSQGDHIDLSAIDASTKSAGNQAFSFIGTKAFSGKAGELRYDKMASDTYIYGDTNGDKKADFAIHLDDAIALQKGDFFL